MAIRLLLRTRFILFICLYAVAPLDFVLIPALDDRGSTCRMNFDHALYAVSYTATTIGFGELPFPFTPAQHMWAAASMDALVIFWACAPGSLPAALEDPAFSMCG